MHNPKTFTAITTLSLYVLWLPFPSLAQTPSQHTGFVVALAKTSKADFESKLILDASFECTEVKSFKKDKHPGANLLPRSNKGPIKGFPPYTTMVYVCKNPTPDTFKAFGVAAIETSAMHAGSGPVRVRSDTVDGGGGAGGCQNQWCGGMYFKNSGPVTCVLC